MPRPGLVMTAPLTYSIEQAAERLGHIVTVDWLKKRVDDIPHLKSGSGRGRAGRIAFTDQHLAEILAMLEKRPTPKGQADDEYRPVGRRRSA
jgi:hypothetical protein